MHNVMEHTGKNVGDMKKEVIEESSQSGMGEDGKMHTAKKTSGQQVECVDGKCKSVQCNGG